MSNKYDMPSGNQIVGLPDIYMDLFGYREGVFVDAGAYDGEMWSSTYTLAKAGWRGLMIEPVQDLADQCRKKTKQFPKVEVVQVAVGNSEEQVLMWLRGSVSTINKEMAKIYDASPSFGHINVQGAPQQSVRVTTLDRILRDRAWPVGFDVLSVDVEGNELLALQGFTIGHWQPRLVMVEAYEKSNEEPLRRRSVAINAYFDDAGYEKIYSDHINNLYLRP